jgi:putative methionine-R-sulfoxide reductase with GAF domain
MQAEIEQIAKQFQADTATIHLLEGGVLVLKAHVGLPPHVAGIVGIVPIGKGMAGLAVERNQPVSSCNIQTDATGDVRPGARATGVGGGIVVPVRDAEGRAQGALGIGVHRAYDYTPEETARLLRTATELGRAVLVGNARTPAPSEAPGNPGDGKG